MNPLNGTDLKGGRVLELVGLFERGLNPSNQDLDLSNQETDPSSHKSDPSNHDSDSGKDSGSESPQSSNRSEKEFSDGKNKKKPFLFENDVVNLRFLLFRYNFFYNIFFCWPF